MQVKRTSLRTNSLILGILLVLVCIPADTRANAQAYDLINAAGKGDLARVRALLDAKADVNAKDMDGGTGAARKSDKDQEFTRVYQYTYDEVFQASQEAIEQMDYFITHKDKDKGTISGNGIFYSKTSVGPMGKKCTFDIHIETLNTKPETRVTIKANVEVWGASASSRLKERLSSEIRKVLATYR